MAAITFDVTPVNGTGVTLDALNSTAQLKVFQITPETALTGGRDGTAAQVAREVSPMLYQAASDGASMIVVVDGHANTAASLLARIVHIIGDASPTDAVAEVTDLYGIA
jgi:hypothetical protein